VDHDLQLDHDHEPDRHLCPEHDLDQERIAHLDLDPDFDNDHACSLSTNDFPDQDRDLLTA
jgi:hypothetical protein